jgi:predicted alpha/beta hydrolase family esterase
MARIPVLFIQGAGDMWAPDGSGVLAKYLETELSDEYKVVAPEMPDADTDPRYEPWRDTIDSEIGALDDGVVLVGHSFGASVLLKYLAQDTPPRSVRAAVLVATPFWSRAGWETQYALPEGFERRLADLPLVMFHSREDPEVPFGHLARYQAALPEAVIRPIEGAQHSFVDGFPELVDEIRALATRT